ncbi:hypothetical protein CBR_g50377, partial [Chara braunii]
MLTTDEETSLLSSLKFAPEDRWLYLFYQCRAKKYGQVTTIEHKFVQLEKDIAEETVISHAEVAGTSLRDNSDLIACKADYHYHKGEYVQAYEVTNKLLERDPYHIQCMPVHLAAALELRRKNELFLRAHKLVQEYPHKAISWFAVGCYYYCIRQYDSARRYFCKATTLDGAFAPAWLGFGHAYAAQDESDQAMAAYRTAARLFDGLICYQLVLTLSESRCVTNWPGLSSLGCFNGRLVVCAVRAVTQREIEALYERFCVLDRNGKGYISADEFMAVPEFALNPLAQHLLRLFEGVNFKDFVAVLSAFSPSASATEKIKSLCIGMEYQRTNNLSLAEQFFAKARNICPLDPLVYNELGVLAFRNKDYESAAKWLRKALSLVPRPWGENWEPTVVNLAHTLRKQ